MPPKEHFGWNPGLQFGGYYTPGFSAPSAVAKPPERQVNAVISPPAKRKTVHERILDGTKAFIIIFKGWRSGPQRPEIIGAYTSGDCEAGQVVALIPARRLVIGHETACRINGVNA